MPSLSRVLGSSERDLGYVVGAVDKVDMVGAVDVVDAAGTVEVVVMVDAAGMAAILLRSRGGEAGKIFRPYCNHIASKNNLFFSDRIRCDMIIRQSII
jgi:hypothetical protein